MLQIIYNSLHEIHKNSYLRFRTWESQTMTEMFIRLFIFHVIRLHQTLPNISIYFPASWITWGTFPHPFQLSSALTCRGHGHLSPLDTQGSWVRQHLHLVMIGHNHWNTFLWRGWRSINPSYRRGVNRNPGFWLRTIWISLGGPQSLTVLQWGWLLLC